MRKAGVYTSSLGNFNEFGACMMSDDMSGLLKLIVEIFLKPRKIDGILKGEKNLGRR